MSKLSYLRIALAVVGIAGALLWPPWVPFAAIVISSLLFRAWEAIFIGLLVDLAWLPSAGSHSVPWATLAAIAIVWALEPLRRAIAH